MASRTGVPSIQKYAMRLCQLLNKYAPGIVLLYPDNQALFAALLAAQAACVELSIEVAKVREYGD